METHQRSAIKGEEEPEKPKTRNVAVYIADSAEYRFAGHVLLPEGFELDIKEEWAKFTAAVGLRLVAQNNAQEHDDFFGGTFFDWLLAAGAQRVEQEEVHLDYVD